MKIGEYLWYLMSMSKTRVFAARNKMLANHNCTKTFRPLNSSRYAHISQWIWDAIHTNMQIKPFHLTFMLLQGRISGNRQKNHTKYCAVITCK